MEFRILCNYSKFTTSHTIKNGDEELEFSMNQLIHASYTVGKQNFEEVHAYPYYSEREMDFRINMIQAFLDLENKYVKRSPIFTKLDPSEKGAVNYFLGMVFTKLIAQHKFQVKWLVHLDLFNGRIEFGTTNKKPDFIGYSNIFSWMAFEAKSRQQNNKDVENAAFDQLENLESINGSNPRLKVASILHGEVSEKLQLKLIDPSEEGKLKINLDEVDYAAHYYFSIYFIIKKDVEIIKRENREFATRDIKCNEAVLGLDLYIYNKLKVLEKAYIEGKSKDEDTNKDNKKEMGTQKYPNLEEIVARELWITEKIENYLGDINKLNEINKDNDKSKEYFIANDGIYIKYYGSNK